MSVVASIPSQAYAPGARTFGPVDIPADVTTIKVTFTREAWPLTIADVVLQVGIEASIDDGSTYPYGAFSQWFGGTRIKRDSSTALSESIARSGIPLTGTRKVRATVTVVASLTTAITVETLTPAEGG